MINMIRRAFAMILSAFVLATVIPTVVFAVDEEPSILEIEAEIEVENHAAELEENSFIESPCNASETLLWPVPGHTALSQGYSSAHKAIDFSDGSISNAPIVAAKSGTVVKKYTCPTRHSNSMGDCDGFGTGLIIQGIDGRYYGYAHMVAYSIPGNINVGSYVEAGTVIGNVGNTGNTVGATGIHLHFYVGTSKYGGEINPSPGVIFNYVDSPAINHPVMDINSAQGGPGYIYFRGWAFDADDYTATLLIHVYADGPAGVGTFVGHTWANQSRQDVNSFYGCGEYHGFETQLQYNSPGTHTFYVYSFIPDSGDTTMQTVTATIQQDSSGPAISNIRITDLDPFGYTITCNVEDSSGVTNVLFPTWPTAYTAEEKAIWYQGTVSGNTASCRITFNDFGNLTCRQEFMTHIHALDGPGNRTMINAGVIGLPNVNSILQPASDLGSDFYAVIQNNDSARTVADRMTLCSTGSRAAFWNYQSAKYMWSRMHFVQNSDGSYIIHSTENENLVLDVVNGYTNTGSVLCFAAYHGWQNQRWNIYKENGLYYLVPQNAPQACLDLAYVQTVNDTEAQIYPFNTGGGQGCDLLIERTISYNANGGSVAPASQTFLSGEIVTLPVPTRSGYIFDGWFTSSEGGTKVTSANTVTGNTTLYAHWTLDGIKITKQPADVSTGYGQAVKFNVAVSGNVFSYQWQYSKDGGKKWINCSATAGANTDTLNVKVSASNAATIYHCVIVGTDGTRVISNPAGVQLLPGAVITLNPKSNAVAIGEYAIFIVEAENAASYQWQYSKDGSHWYNSGAEGYKTDTLTVKGSQNSQGNRYRCVVTGIDGNKKKSYMATMIVMTRAPKACTAKVGETASYSLKAEGIESYQWQYSKDNGVTWYKSSATGADTDTVTFKATATNRTMIYRCKLTTADGATAFTKPVGFV